MPKHRRGHGEGGIYQRASDSKWCASVELPSGVGGKRQRKVLYGRTRREVAEKLKALHTDLASGSVFDDARLTVDEVLDRRIASPKLEDTTREVYTKLARLYVRPKIGKVKIDKLTTGHLQHALDTIAREISPGTARGVWVLLSGALRPLTKAGRIKSHVLDLVEPPAYEPPRGDKKEQLISGIAASSQFGIMV